MPENDESDQQLNDIITQKKEKLLRFEELEPDNFGTFLPKKPQKKKRISSRIVGKCNSVNQVYMMSNHDKLP